MRGINKVILIGTLGADPESRTTASGTMVCNFRIATNETWTDKQSGEKRERAEWHSIVCFGKTAELAGEYLRKGSKVYVEGKLRTEKWQDKEGKDRFTTKVYADGIQFLDSRKDGAQRTESRQQSMSDNYDSDEPNRGPGEKPSTSTEGAEEFDDDINF